MLRYLGGVVTLRLDAEACNGCGMCAIVCPHGVFSIEDRMAVIADRDACNECGACALNCPANAIRVQTGVGCATAVLKGKTAPASERRAPCCGASPAVATPTQTDCCGSQTENTRDPKRKA